MTNTELIAKIKAEIRRTYGEQGFNSEDAEYGYRSCARDLLSFLSTLESEKPINPDDAMKKLDEKIALVKERGTWDGVDVDKYMDEVRGREPEKPMNMEKMEREEELKKAVHQVSEEIVKEIFPDDLENGDFFTEVDLKNCITRVAYQFADWQKEQMMKEAVQGKIIFLLNGDVAVNIGDTDKYNLGQKIRVIVLPKED